MSKFRPGATMMFVAALAVAFPAYAADATYAVKLTRPMKTGDSYQVHHVIDMANTQSTKLPGMGTDNQEQALKADLSGRCDVLDVDANGSQKNVKLTIDKFTVGDGKEALAAGKVVDIKRGEKATTFTVQGGGTLGDDAKNALTLAFPPLSSTQVTDDAAFGSKTSRAPGESWPVDPVATAKQANESGMTMDAKSVTGTTTLKGVEKANGGDALRIVTEMTVPGVVPSDLPKGVVIDSSQLWSHVENVLPVDDKLPAAETYEIMDLQFVTSTPGATGMTVTIKSHISDKATFSPIKK